MRKNLSAVLRRLVVLLVLRRHLLWGGTGAEGARTRQTIQNIYNRTPVGPGHGAQRTR